MDILVKSLINNFDDFFLSKMVQKVTKKFTRVLYVIIGIRETCSLKPNYELW